MGTNYAKMTTLERATLRITNWMGTPASLIAHTIAFAGIFTLHFVGFTFNQIMLILTTAVSLEAIYLALFIQMTVNRNTASLEDVEEDVEDLESNLKKINKSVSNLAEDVDEIQEDVGEIQENVDEIQEDVDEIQEDIDEISTDDPSETEHLKYVRETHQAMKLVESKITSLTSTLQELQADIDQLQAQIKQTPKSQI